MPDFELFRKVVKSAGCAIIGQTAELAPADRRFYAVRDVTGTVESVPLITASILAKKIAAGLGALVMDVKVGNGAFMESNERAHQLAESIIRTAATAGLKTHALVTDMNEVLGTTAGNALEIAESMRYLRNEEREVRLNEVVLGLTAEMLLAAGIEKNRDDAIRHCDEAVTSGAAAVKFAKMCAGLGGPGDFVERYDEYLPKASVVQPVYAEGYLAAVDTRAVGNLIIELGGGRRKVGEALDLSVGLCEMAGIGAHLDAQRPLAVLHATNDSDADKAVESLLALCTFSPDPPPERPVIYDILTR
jgi:thymidine phosphorylase